MTTIAGRSAFVTGGASGIGLGLAQALLERGAHVAIVDRNEDLLKEASRKLANPNLVTAVLDVRDRTRYAAVADEIEAKIGRISLLFNNAGVGGGGEPNTVSYEQWDYLLGINLGGVINGIQTFLPRLVERGDGHIINTASGAGLGTAGRAAGGILYITSKFAVVGMSEALNILLAERGIGVSVFCPGIVSTNIVSAASSFPPPRVAPSEEEMSQMLAENAPFMAAMANAMSPLDAGRIVMDAVESNQLFIHTDRVMENAVRKRTEAILSSMPTNDRWSPELRAFSELMRAEEDKVFY